MRNIKWLRYGLASTVLACGAFGAILIACGDDDGGGGVTATDGGKDNNTPPNDSGGNNDTGGGNDSGGDSATPAPAKIVLVHAATDYGPNNPLGMVRVCYATKTATEANFGLSPLSPLPHSKDPDSQLPFPGIPIGTGGPFPSTGLPLEQFSIRPYVISAQALANRGITGNAPETPRCNRLLQAGFVPDGGFPDAGDAGALTENVDYWTLADIPVGQFKNKKTYILAVTGCTADTNSTTFFGKCGPDPTNPTQPYNPPGTPGKGNLTIAVLELDATTTVAANEIGVQVAHLSPSYESQRSVTTLDAGAVWAFKPVFGAKDAGGDANAYVAATTDERRFTQPPTITPLAKLKGVATADGFFAANDDDFPGQTPLIPIQLNNFTGMNPALGQLSIQYLSENKTVPATAQLYVNGKSYTFVLVGDPTQTQTLDPLTNLRRAHYLAYPNVFTPPSTQ